MDAERIFSKQCLNNYIRNKPYVSDEISDSTKLFGLVDNVLSQQNFSGKNNEIKRDYSDILKLSINKLNSIINSSKTFNTYLKNIESFVQDNERKDVDEFIRKNVSVNKPQKNNVNEEDACELSLIFLLNYFDIKRAQEKGLVSFISLNGILYFISKDGSIFYFTPEIVETKIDVSDDSLMSSFSESIAIVSRKKDKISIFDLNKFEITQNYKLSEFVNIEYPILCIGETSFGLEIVQRNKKDIIITELPNDFDTNARKAIITSKKAEEEDSLFYFDGTELIEVKKSELKTNKDAPMHIVNLESGNYLISNGWLHYMNDSKKIAEIFLSISSRAENLMKIMLKNAKTSDTFFTRNFYSVSKYIAEILMRMPYIEERMRVIKIKTLLYIIAFNLRKQAFLDMDPSIGQNVDEIFKCIIPYVDSLTVPILDCVRIIPNPSYLNFSIIKNVLRPAFEKAFMNPMLKDVVNEVLKTEQSILLIDPEFLLKLPIENASNLIIRTIDYFSICYVTMNSFHVCIQYIEAVFNTLSGVISNKQFISAERIVQHFICQLISVKKSPVIGSIYISKIIPIISELTEHFSKEGDFQECNSNFVGLDKIRAVPEYNNSVKIPPLSTEVINTKKIRPTVIMFSNVSHKCKVTINGSMTYIFNGMKMSKDSTLFPMTINNKSDLPLSFDINAKQVIQQKEDVLDTHLFLINYLAKLASKFAQDCLIGRSISRKERNNEHITKNFYVRSIKELISNENSELDDPVIKQIFSGEKKENNKIIYCLYFLDSILNEFSRKSSQKKYERCLTYALSALITQLEMSEEISKFSEKVFNVKPVKSLRKDIPKNIIELWKTLGNLRRNLMFTNQKTVVSVDQTNIKENVDLYIKEVEEKSKLLIHTKITPKYSTEEKNLHEILEYITADIPISVMNSIIEEQNSRLNLRIKALDFMSEFLKCPLVESTKNTFLVCFENTLEIVSDSKTSDIGSYDRCEALKKSINNFADIFLDVLKTKSDIIYISFIKLFCNVTDVYKQYANGLVHIIKSDEKFIKQAEEVLISIIDNQEVSDALISQYHESLSSIDSSSSSAFFFLFTMIPNAKVPYETLLAPEKKQRKEISGLVLAEKLIVKDDSEEAKQILSETMPRLINELGSTILGSNDRFSVASEITTFFRYLMLPFSVHKDTVQEYIHSLLNVSSYVYTENIVAAFAILGHGVFRAEDTGIVYNKNNIRLPLNDCKPKDFEKLFPASRVPPSPMSFTLRDNEVRLIVRLQEKINSIIDNNKEIDIKYSNAVAFFMAFVSVIVQNPENAKKLSEYSYLYSRLISYPIYTEKAIIPNRVFTSFAETMYMLSQINPTGEEGQYLEKMVALSCGSVFKDKIDSSPTGLSIFVGENKIKSWDSAIFKVRIIEKGIASLGFISADSTVPNIQFYGIKGEFMENATITMSFSANCISVSGSNQGFFYSGFIGDVYPAIIIDGYRMKASYFIKTNIATYKERCSFVKNTEKMKMEIRNAPKIEYNEVPPPTLNYEIPNIMECHMIGSKVVMHNGTVAEIEKRFSSEACLKICSRDGSCEIVKVPLESYTIIPEPLHRLVHRAKRAGKNEKQYETYIKNSLFKRHLSILRKLIHCTAIHICSCIEKNPTPIILFNMMTYALKFNLQATELHEKHFFKDNTITQLNYSLPGEKYAIRKYIKESINKFDIQDLAANAFNTIKLTRIVCPPSTSIHFMDEICILHCIDKKKTDAAVFPINFDCEREISTVLENDTYAFNFVSEISYIIVPKYLPYGSLPPSVYLVHIIFQIIWMANQSSDKLYQNVIAGFRTTDKIYEASMKLIAKPIIYSLLNNSQIKSAISIARSICVKSIDNNHDKDNMQKYFNLCQMIVDRSKNLDYFEELVNMLCAPDTPEIKLFLNYALLLDIDKSTPQYFSVFALYRTFGYKWITYYKECQEYSQTWTNIYDYNICMEEAVGVNNKSIFNLRKEMINECKEIIKTPLANFFNVFWINCKLESVISMINDLPHHQQFHVNFNRISAFNFFNGKNGLPLLNQFLRIMPKDFNKLRVFNKPPWHVSLYGENAVDAGGPGRELFTSICKEIVAPELKIFCSPPDSSNQKLIPLMSNDKKFEAAGAFMAACITTMLQYPFDIADYVWKAISGDSLGINDVYSVYRSFQNMITDLEYAKEDNDEELQAHFHQRFVIKDLYGENLELVPNGSQIRITVENKDLFISLAKNALIKQIQKSVRGIKKGFYSVIPDKIITKLTYKEVRKLCCGEKVITIEELRKHIKIEFINYRSNKEKWKENVFWKAISCLTNEERRLLVTFITGSCTINDNVHIEVYVTYDHSYLPTAATCFSKMFTIPFTSYNEFLNAIKIAMEYSSVITDSEITENAFI